MGAIKGVGMGAVQTIVETRKEGHYKSIFDLAKRIDLRAANKKAFENLALAGGFDCFSDTHRAQYFHTDGDNITFYEKAIRYGAKFQENENSSQVSLFGDASDVQIAEPTVPPSEDWSTMEKLAKEKEVVGIYISGHPLDDFKFEMKYFCSSKLENLKNLGNYIGKNLTFAGIVTNVQYKTAKNGKDWAMFTLEGYDESHEFRIFDEEYLKFRHFLVNNQFVYFKVGVKDGWVNRETGKKSEPRIQFLDVKQLQDVLPQFAKKLSIQLEINDLHKNLIQQLNDIFKANEGDKSVNFEVIETEIIAKPIEIIKPVETVSAAHNDEEIDMENLDGNEIIEEDIAEISPIPAEEIRRVTTLEMPSRRLKIRISSELLLELEKMKVKFSLN